MTVTSDTCFSVTVTIILILADQVVLSVIEIAVLSILFFAWSLCKWHNKVDKNGKWLLKVAFTKLLNTPVLRNAKW